MIKLIETGLFGDKLVVIDSPLMVKRYNSCLTDIGLSKTKLKSFHIDGWGWSPEIAEEQKDRFYLSHGLANPYGIIVTPSQEHSSIYMPFHSFDVEIHKAVFSQFKEQIVDITAQCGLWFELDQEITAYRSPQDLLMIDYISVNFVSVDRVMNAAKSQRAFIREFYDVPQAWSKNEVRDKIIESSRKFGDLRFRKFDIPAFPFSEVDNYFTVAFDGLYMLKNLNNSKPVLIFSNNKSNVSNEEMHAHVEYNLNDPSLLSYLYSKNIVSDEIDSFESQKALLEIAKDYVLVKAAVGFDPNLRIESLSRTQKKGVLNQLIKANKLPEKYFELEQIIMKLDNKETVSSVVSDSVRSHLLHPHKDLEASQKLVIWKLLCSLYDNNPLLSYLFDKPNFYSQYGQWSEQLQAWVVKKLLEHKDIYNQLI